MLTLLALAIPVQVPALPLYIALADLGLLNTYFSMMVPFFLSVFAIFLLRQFFKGFPDDIIQAARLDGMSELEIVWRIVVPSAWPAIAAFAVFSFVAHWNDLYWPLIVISDAQPRAAAARHDVLRRRRDGLELRRADRRRDDPHRAAGDRLPARAAPVHRRHHDDGRQVSDVPPQSLSPAASRVQQALDAAGVAATIVEYPSAARTSAQAAEVLGCAVGQIAKSLVFRAASGRAVLVIASGANRVDEAKVAALIGEPIGKADPAFVRAATGFAIGGIPPLGHPAPLAPLIDRNLLDYDVVYAAGGTPNAMFPVSPADLVRASLGTPADVALST